ncbi:protease modulator HflC [Bowmanella denitrificans]|uniref:Protein HflC n=1 Tax=Bowmanella denitrificans TaxID=366582 RepID=A0ABN0XVL5_9ALTE|nr:protease modulator HflC [Bowmanella denitrificans]
MKNFIIALLIVLVILGFGSVFVVEEGYRGIVIQFGKVRRDSETGQTVVYEPGIYLKLPFIDTVKQLTSKVQTLDDGANRFVTAEKKDLIVDSYVKWRIKDFATYYLATGGFKDQAETLLKQKVNNGLRTEFGSRTISEIVSGERSELMNKAMKQSAESAVELGIEIVDVRVKQINLPLEISNSIYDRMRAERAAVAKEHRSQGREQAEIHRADIDAKVTVMLADAERNARKLRGEGDAEAAKIYADAYTKNAEFYAFLRSMDAYRKSFNNKQDVLILEPDSDFFRYMNDTKGKKN